MSGPAQTGIGARIAPPRFLLCGALLLVAAAAAWALGAEPRIALLIGFDLAALVFLGAALPLFRADPAAMRRTAERNDANRAALLTISVLLSLVILFAIGTLIARPETPHWIDVVLIVTTLVLAWLFANTVFTLHYAHLFYLQSANGDQGGLEVPGVREPDYWDFLYFSLTLGMTFQTSDVTITGAHMRKVVLGHCVAAFLFNMGILAFTVNALGGL
ncbi:conserved membrane hypothetical protein [Cupriavidus phytorum]|uniref:DUF1345 domain-containing protein n=2 Tax=Cupriavidus TaxID=106589 RepID=A0A976AA92_9BURK|nr:MULTISPECIES: DUF1345 domain-containing protein [Cupriavidus]PZX34217.1 putative membrane protein [Cupriavidus alkaliphilus]SOY71898.1 conserved membrane hypothetical protein [Cupriavidus taiwanensis]